MKRSVPIFSVLILTLVLSLPRGARGADPSAVQYLNEPDSLFWFLAISDTHLTSSFDGHEIENLEWATSVLFSTVEPIFMVTLGDLTDATASPLIYDGQHNSEWELYRDTVSNAGMTPDIYHDIPGNHDQYSEGDLAHYLQYSVSGQYEAAINHSWTYENNYGKYLFLGLATCGANGAPWPADDAGLDQVDQNFINETLQQNEDADFIFTLGHHPLGNFGDGKGWFKNLLQEKGVSLYMYGHSHDYSQFWESGALQFNLRSMAMNQTKQVGLVAMDGGGLSARAFTKDNWPLVMITAPLNAELGGSHLQDYKVPWYLDEAPLRVIAFHPQGIALVDYSLDGGEWIPMDPAGDHIWQSFYDATDLSEFPHKIEVRAHGNDGSIQTDLIRFFIDMTAEDPNPQPDPPVESDYPDVVTEDSMIAEGTSVEYQEIIEEVGEYEDSTVLDAGPLPSDWFAQETLDEEVGKGEVSTGADTRIDTAFAEVASDAGQLTDTVQEPVSDGRTSNGCSQSNTPARGLGLGFLIMLGVLLAVRVGVRKV